MQSLSWNTNYCPTGVAAERVKSFHHNTVKGLADMLAAAGLSHPDELGPHHLVRRISVAEVRQFSELHAFLQPGELLDGESRYPTYARNWATASAEGFEAMAA